MCEHASVCRHQVRQGIVTDGQEASQGDFHDAIGGLASAQLIFEWHAQVHPIVVAQSGKDGRVFQDQHLGEEEPLAPALDPAKQDHHNPDVFAQTGWRQRTRTVNVEPCLFRLFRSVFCAAHQNSSTTHVEFRPAFRKGTFTG